MKIERCKVGTKKWELVAISRFLWPKDLLENLQSGIDVVFDGYIWRKIK